MNVYGTKAIRNVVLLGHGGAGKTTAAEAMALLTGVWERLRMATPSVTMTKRKSNASSPFPLL